MTVPAFQLDAGSFSVSLASARDEIDDLQALRYRVFVQEMGATSSLAATAIQRDVDKFDDVADHLIVVDNESKEMARRTVATCRLLRCSAAAKLGGFYSAEEYDVESIQSFPGRILELGRSCVDPEYRHRPVMHLLWSGIAAYVFHNEIDLMFGCASFPGINPLELGPQLSLLYHEYLAPPHLRPFALPHRRVEMGIVAAEQLDVEQTLSCLPPLIKGYLRLGGFVGDGAVIDTEFNTTDVAIILKTDSVTEKYYKHYERKIVAENMREVRRAQRFLR